MKALLMNLKKHKLDIIKQIHRDYIYNEKYKNNFIKNFKILYNTINNTNIVQPCSTFFLFESQILNNCTDCKAISLKKK